jgi:invasion protein IalB
MRGIDETPKRHILGRNRVDWCITCGRRAFVAGCAFAQQVTRKKTPRTGVIFVKIDLVYSLSDIS